MKEIYILLCEGVVSSHKVCEPFLSGGNGLREKFESIGDRGMLAFGCPGIVQINIDC